MGNAGSPDDPTGIKTGGTAPAVATLPRDGAPVEVVRIAERAVQSHRKLDQRSKINLGPFGPHAVECCASVLAARNIEIGEGRQKKGHAVACRSMLETWVENALDPRYFFSSSKVPSLRISG